MYLIQAKADATAPDFPGQDVKWKAGQVKFVHESLIEFFRSNPAAWAVVSDLDQVPVMGTKDVTGGIEYSAGGKLIYSTRGQRIKDAICAAFLDQPAINKAPWTASPAWAGSTAYAKSGAVVQNGGNLYVLQTAGTSAASGGPSGAGVALITDGTCKWYYVGPVIAPVGSPIPAVSYASAATASLTKAVPFNAVGAYFYSGGLPTAKDGGYVFPASNVAPSAGNATGTYDGSSPTVTFLSDAPKIVIQGNSPYYNNTGISVEVDGRFIQYGALAPAALLNPGGFVIDWAGSRKVRKYRVWMQANSVFYGVYVDPSSTVVAAKNANRYRVVVNGDSLTQGASGIPYIGRTWPDTFGSIVGCDDLYSCAAGGTGFIENAGTKTTYIQRLPDIIGFAPDVHIVAGCINDSAKTQAEIQAAALAYIQAFRAASSAYLLIFGTTSGTLGATDASILKIEAALLAAVIQSGDSRTFFMPVSTDDVPWINGTGNVGAQAGNGNADVYIQFASGPHYTQGGVDYVAQKYAQAYANWARSIS